MSKSDLFKKTEEIDFENYQPSARAEFILSLCREPGKTPPPEMADPLSDDERERFETLEAFVVENFATFYAVGCALREINGKRLYREKAPTFQRYCKQVEVAARTAYQYISAADVVDDLRLRLPEPKMCAIAHKPENDPVAPHFSSDSEHIYETTDASDLYSAPDAPPSIPLPANEAQARPLTKVKDPSERAAVWVEAVRNARGPRVTATDVKQAIHRRHSETIVTAVKKAADTLIYTPARDRASSSFKEAFQAFLNELFAAQQGKWRDTSLEHVIVCLDVLREAVAPDTFEGERLPMPSGDAMKAKAAGFELYRADVSMMAIKRMDANGNWRKHSPTLSSKAALNRELKRILQDPKAIMG